LRALAKKADALWSLHGMRPSFSASVASLVDVDEPAAVAAVSSRGASRGGGGRGRGGWGGHAGSSRGGSQQSGGLQVPSHPKAAASLPPREMAWIQSGLCVKHFAYGDKAHSCTPPCNWVN
jgi:hypothetical protein